MPAGCNFVCKNEDCSYHGMKMSMIGPWPLGEIDEILEKKDTEDEEYLKKLKAEGREYFCIAFPNDEKLPMYGWRVQRWCPKCVCMWDYDVMLENEDQEFKDAIENADIPKYCPKCNKTMKTFEDVLEENLKCPSCSEYLDQERWFANENPVVKERR